MWYKAICTLDGRRTYIYRYLEWLHTWIARASHGGTTSPQGYRYAKGIVRIYTLDIRWYEYYWIIYNWCRSLKVRRGIRTYVRVYTTPPKGAHRFFVSFKEIGAYKNWIYYERAFVYTMHSIYVCGLTTFYVKTFTSILQPYNKTRAKQISNSAIYTYKYTSIYKNCVEKTLRCIEHTIMV